jgi:uracil phosphoribosyltransferase
MLSLTPSPLHPFFTQSINMSSSNVHVISHPFLAAKLASIEDRSIDSTALQRLVAQATTILTVEATKDIKPEQKCALLPLMRSGLAMVDSVLNVIVPGNKVVVHHLGLFRERETLQVVEYYNNIPTAATPVDLAIIVDPLLATGSTSVAAIETLKWVLQLWSKEINLLLTAFYREWGVGEIIFIALMATNKGLKRAAAVWPGKVKFFVAAIKELDGMAHNMPGIGDIGDRLFIL